MDIPVKKRPTDTPESDEIIPLAARYDEIAAWSQLVLASLAVGFALYWGRELLLPIASAFVIGVMVSPIATFLEKYRVPRLLSAFLIVGTTAGMVTLVVGLISAPLAEWSGRLPELGSALRDKLHFFDAPLAWWRQLGGESKSAAALIPEPKLEWLPTTIAFLSPTLTEFLFFLAVLLLFIASWPGLRRGLVMILAQRESRLTALRILNEIESSLAGYLRTVALVNLGVGVTVVLICMATGTPGPVGLGALAAIFNFVPIIGPIVMFAVLLVVGIATAPTIGAGLLAAAAFLVVVSVEGQFVTPHIIGRRLSLNGLAVVLSLAFWTWLWGPIGALLSSPLLIVGLILRDHLLTDDSV